MEDQSTKEQKKKRKHGGGRPKVMTEERVALLKTLIAAHPGAGVRELTTLFNTAASVEVSSGCVWLALKAMGFKKQRRSSTLSKSKQPAEERPVDLRAPFRRASSGRQAALCQRPKRSSGKKRYGYTGLHRIESSDKKYPSSLTDAEWALVYDLFENRGDRPPIYPRRLMLDACCYVVRSGCSWRMLPKDFPPWQDVYAHWRRWSEAGLIEEMNERLRQMWRIKAGRKAQPTAAIADSQSIKNSPQGGDVGFDKNKHVKGRRRHLVTDVLGLLLAVVVLPADIQDRDGLVPALEQAKRKFPHITKLYLDGGYIGDNTHNFCQSLGIDSEVVKSPAKYIWSADPAVEPLFEPLCAVEEVKPQEIAETITAHSSTELQSTAERGKPSEVTETSALSSQAPPLNQPPSSANSSPTPAAQPEKPGFQVVKKRWVIERTNAWNLRFRRLVVDHDRRPEVIEHWIWFAESLILLRRIAHGDQFSATIT